MGPAELDVKFDGASTRKLLVGADAEAFLLPESAASSEPDLDDPPNVDADSSEPESESETEATTNGDSVSSSPGTARSSTAQSVGRGAGLAAPRRIKPANGHGCE